MNTDMKKKEINMRKKLGFTLQPDNEEEVAEYTKLQFEKEEVKVKYIDT